MGSSSAQTLISCGTAISGISRHSFQLLRTRKWIFSERKGSWLVLWGKSSNCFGGIWLGNRAMSKKYISIWFIKDRLLKLDSNGFNTKTYPIQVKLTMLTINSASLSRILAHFSNTSSRQFKKSTHYWNYSRGSIWKATMTLTFPWAWPIQRSQAKSERWSSGGTKSVMLTSMSFRGFSHKLWVCQTSYSNNGLICLCHSRIVLISSKPSSILTKTDLKLLNSLMKRYQVDLLGIWIFSSTGLIIWRTSWGS